MIFDVTKPDLITIIDHHASNAKGLLSNSLMINDIDPSRSYHNNYFIVHQPQNCVWK